MRRLVICWNCSVAVGGLWRLHPLFHSDDVELRQETTSLTSPVIFALDLFHTTSSGMLFVWFFANSALTASQRQEYGWTATRMTSSISDKLKPASERLANWSFRTFYKITVDIEFRTSQNFNWRGPAAPAVMNSKQFVLKSRRKSFFAFRLRLSNVGISQCWQVDTIFFLEFFNHVVDDFWSSTSPPVYYPLQLPIHQDTITPVQDRNVRYHHQVEYQRFFFFIVLSKP